jgi:hypothetical protein
MSGEWQTDLKIFGAALFAYFTKGAVLSNKISEGQRCDVTKRPTQKLML